jgi:hypothetical protein
MRRFGTTRFDRVSEFLSHWLALTSYLLAWERRGHVNFFTDPASHAYWLRRHFIDQTKGRCRETTLNDFFLPYR